MSSKKQREAYVAGFEAGWGAARKVVVLHEFDGGADLLGKGGVRDYLDQQASPAALEEAINKWVSHDA